MPTIIKYSFSPSDQFTVLTTHVNHCFDVIRSWMLQYYLQLNESKTQIIVFESNKTLQSVVINGVNLLSGTTIRFVSVVKNLGVQMDNKLTFALKQK